MFCLITGMLHALIQFADTSAAQAAKLVSNDNCLCLFCTNDTCFAEISVTIAGLGHYQNVKLSLQLTQGCDRGRDFSVAMRYRDVLTS